MSEALAPYVEQAIQYIQGLCAIPSPTGFTRRIESHVTDILTGLGFAPQYSVKRSVRCLLGGSGTPLVLAAHLDTLGAMVRAIKPNGRLRITKLGGFPENYIEGENCVVHSRAGREFTGRFLLDKPAVHVNKDVGSAKRDDSNLELVLDEPVRRAAEVQALGIGPGDFVSFDPRTVLTASGYIKSRHLDDKASAGILLALAAYVRDATEATRDTAGLVRDAAAPVCDAAAPVRDAAARDPDAAARDRDAAAPVRDAAAPVRDAAARDQDAAAGGQALAAAVLGREVWLVFTNFEEAGHGGAAGLPAGAVEMLAVDMGAIGDDLGTDEHCVSICAKDSGGPYDHAVTSALAALATSLGLRHAVDIYPFYGSDAGAALRAGYDLRHGLIGPGVQASHGYERIHRDGIANTLALLAGYIKQPGA
jgi:putative aminopeptidase FrvX